MDEVTLAKKTFRLGEEKPVVVIAHDYNAADISGGTATIAVYDSGGSVVLAATNMTQSGGTNGRLKLSYQLTTGAGKTITAAGSYRGLVKHTLGGVIRYLQIPIEVQAAPS